MPALGWNFLSCCTAQGWFSSKKGGCGAPSPPVEESQFKVRTCLVSKLPPPLKFNQGVSHTGATLILLLGHQYLTALISHSVEIIGKRKETVKEIAGRNLQTSQG